MALLVPAAGQVTLIRNNQYGIAGFWGAACLGPQYHPSVLDFERCHYGGTLN